MKLMYKIMIFFAIFPVMVMMVNSLGIFPYTFYGDDEMTKYVDFDERSAPEVVLSQMLVPSKEITGMPEDRTTDNLTIGVIVLTFVGIGSAIAWFTKGNFAPMVIMFLGYSFFNMVTKSYSLFSKIFYNFNTTEMAYLGLVLGIGIVVIVVITIIETPAHGRSGT